VIYELLFRRGRRDAADDRRDPRHLGARIGATLVLHTWGSALTHHPHVHGIVPAAACRRRAAVDRLPAGLLPVRARALAPVPAPLLEELAHAHAGRPPALLRRARRLGRGARLRRLAGATATGRVGGLRQAPVAGPEAVLAYLSRYTHRVAISNRRLLGFDERGVTFRWKDYRAKGRTRYKTMTLAAAEFMAPLLLHVLPAGFHTHPALRAARQRRAQELPGHRSRSSAAAAGEPAETHSSMPASPPPPAFACRHCGAPMIVVETLQRLRRIRSAAGWCCPRNEYRPCTHCHRRSGATARRPGLETLRLFAARTRPRSGSTSRKPTGASRRSRSAHCLCTPALRLRCRDRRAAVQTAIALAADVVRSARVSSLGLPDARPGLRQLDAPTFMRTGIRQPLTEAVAESSHRLTLTATADRSTDRDHCRPQLLPQAAIETMRSVANS